MSPSVQPLARESRAAARASGTPHTLSPADAPEVLAFLAGRPPHTVNIASLVRDNGLSSPLNRGTFHAFRDERGRLEGVALIGHAILFESRSERATAAFARLAQQHPNAHIILGESAPVELFWSHYAEGGQPSRRLCRELLLEQRWPVEARASVKELRPATADDAEAVLTVHAGMVFEQSGVNPLESDPEGFRARCLRRIERGRTWVVTEGGRLVFKAEVYAETPQAAYLEGVYVAPERRGEGHGLRCLSQLTRGLLLRADSVCLLVNELNIAARAFYRKAGYRRRAAYDTIFLRKS
jgi:predicted GNAT family acetyltransferase